MIFPRRPKIGRIEPPTAATTLFRDSALLFHRTAGGGSARIVQPLPIIVLTSFMIAVAGLAGSSWCEANTRRKESVAGFLEPVGGVIRIFPQRGGVISAVLVHEGQSVAQGRLLFKVEVPQTMADGGAADRKLLAGLDVERAELTTTRERTLSASGPRPDHAGRASRGIESTALAAHEARPACNVRSAISPINSGTHCTSCTNRRDSGHAMVSASAANTSPPGRKNKRPAN